MTRSAYATFHGTSRFNCAHPTSISVSADLNSSTMLLRLLPISSIVCHYSTITHFNSIKWNSSKLAITILGSLGTSRLTLQLFRRAL